MKKFLLILLLSIIVEASFAQAKIKFAIVVSANMEWRATKKVLPDEKYLTSPWGEYFFKEFEKENVLVF
jgi:hypothetical protein